MDFQKNCSTNYIPIVAKALTDKIWWRFHFKFLSWPIQIFLHSNDFYVRPCSYFWKSPSLRYFRKEYLWLYRYQKEWLLLPKGSFKELRIRQKLVLTKQFDKNSRERKEIKFSWNELFENPRCTVNYVRVEDFLLLLETHLFDIQSKLKRGRVCYIKTITDKKTCNRVQIC